VEKLMYETNTALKHVILYFVSSVALIEQTDKNSTHKYYEGKP
jgi:hypothetical protein